jgi:predicted dehydrogenase
MEHFIECIQQDRPPRVTGLDGLRAVQLVLAVNRSIQSGQAVELAEEKAS